MRVSTAHDRFQAWVDDGFFLRFWQAGLAAYDAFRGIDWTWMSMDGAMTKAPLAGEKNRAFSGRSKQNWHQTLVARGGWRRASRLVGRRANRNDFKLLEETLQSIPIEQPAAEEYLRHLCLDKGYDYEEVRHILHAYGLVAHIRSRGEEAQAKKEKAWPEGTPLGGRAHPLLVQPLSQHPHALEQESQKLSGHALLRLRTHLLPRCPIFRIGS